ncbi:MAG TPA: GNAT family N-acetyltransferase [Chloroflexota bacterium]
MTRPPESPKAEIRIRRNGDLDACVDLLAEVHASDHYPLHWPADPHGWLTPDILLTAWVAEKEGSVVGHVALCSAAGDPAAPLWSAASGLPPEHIATVARLFVAPWARGQGLGAALLTRACAVARSHELLPAIEVLDRDGRAIALYERVGWQRVASAPATWASATLHYYVSPPEDRQATPGG